MDTPEHEQKQLTYDQLWIHLINEVASCRAMLRVSLENQARIMAELEYATEEEELEEIRERLGEVISEERQYLTDWMASFGRDEEDVMK